MLRVFWRLGLALSSPYCTKAPKTRLAYHSLRPASAAGETRAAPVPPAS